MSDDTLPIPEQLEPELGLAPPIVRPLARHYIRDLVIGDVAIVVIVALGAAAAGILRAPSTLASTDRIYLVVAFIAVWPFMLWQQRSRAVVVLGHGLEEYRLVLAASLWTAALVATGAYVLSLSTHLAQYLGTLVLATLLLEVFRHLMRVRLGRLWREGPLQRVFIVAPPDQAQMLAYKLTDTSQSFGVAGHRMLRVDETPSRAQIVAEALDADADTILFSPTAATGQEWTRGLSWELADAGLNLLIAPSLIDVAGPRLTVVPVQGLPLIHVEIPKFSPAANAFRRTFDIMVSLTLLVVLAVPLAVVSLLIKLGSPGPVIFRQRRVGRDGMVFDVLKFRTMVDGADDVRGDLRDSTASDSSDVLFKLKADPRVTKIGKTLRRYSIDELPQLVNVLKGDMSLVGPRPHSLDDVQRYGKNADRRWLTKPGMTGLWQVSGRSDLDWETALRLDLYYVDNWSPALDLVIMARTVETVVRGSGAY